MTFLSAPAPSGKPVQITCYKLRLILVEQEYELQSLTGGDRVKSRFFWDLA